MKNTHIKFTRNLVEYCKNTENFLEPPKTLKLRITIRTKFFCFPQKTLTTNSFLTHFHGAKFNFNSGLKKNPIQVAKFNEDGSTTAASLCTYGAKAKESSMPSRTSRIYVDAILSVASTSLSKTEAEVECRERDECLYMF